MKKLVSFALAAILLLSVCPFTASAAQKQIDQTKDYSDEPGMYQYTFCFTVSNPVNLDDSSTDSVEELWFDITYITQNGYGTSATYRLDMSWNGKGNYNSRLLRTFLRYDDNPDTATMNVWVPGLISNVKIHLNMCSFERLSFSLDAVLLNGLRANRGTGSVSSVMYDSDDSVPCKLPKARIASTESGLRDNYGSPADTELSKLYEANPSKYSYHR